MKERPILFSGEMVRAILDGTKTQTRRVIKPRLWSTCVGVTLFGEQWQQRVLVDGRLNYLGAKEDRMTCPFGVPGERLWVRETWGHTGTDVWTVKDATERAMDGKVIYRATYDGPQVGGWFPSIHMPRRFSRITLELTGVRVERLQGISLEDVRAEGFPHFAAFRQAWEAIYGEESWEETPWVWVVEFRRILP